jgi:site-specific recombinase XerD
VKIVMALAGIPKAQSKPKALRHAFAIEGTQERISLFLLKKWLGHAKLETTEIYATPLGREERALARLMWRWLPREFEAPDADTSTRVD